MNVPISDKSAAASAYGFLRQLDRVFLWLLLKAEPGSTVTFECCDDVGVHSPDGIVLAEQDISSRWKTYGLLPCPDGGNRQDRQRGEM